jgi:uncharacterized protein DUF6220
MRKTYAVLAILLLLVVVAQFFAAATGAFSTAPRDTAFAPHYALGWVVFGLPLVLTLVAALARLGRRLVLLPLLISALASLQVGIAALARAAGTTTPGQLTFGLHGVNGLAILLIAILVLQRSRPFLLRPRRTA